MYDMYPEWGPAKNRPRGSAFDDDGTRTTAHSLQTSLDLRDNGGERPDDN